MVKNDKSKGERPTQSVNKRLMMVYAGILLVFMILIGRLFFMQVVKGAEYTQTAENNIDRVVNVQARRGVIYDKNDNILASSEPFMSVNVYLDEVDDREALAKNLADLFNREDIYTAEEEARDMIGASTIKKDVENNTRELQQKAIDEAIAKGETPPKFDNSSTEEDGSDNENDSEQNDSNSDNENDSSKNDDKALDGTIAKNDMVTTEEILELLPSSGNNYKPVSVRSYTYDVGVKVAQIVAENKDIYPGVVIGEEAMRTYPYGYFLGQVLGTVGKISEEQLEEEKDTFGYKLTDVVGKNGLEKYYEHYTQDGKEMGLRGQDGKRYLEVDATGNIINVISEEPPVSGNSLKLSIDLNTQMHMENALRQIVAEAANPKCIGGSAVLLDVKTGGVLGMASVPSVDPNDFVRGLTTEEYDYYFSDNLKPQLNRSISGVYSPGSTFKLVCATALRLAGVPVTDTLVCTGTNVREPMAGCWDLHGGVDFYRATAGSCNIYFQNMAAKIGEEKLLEVGRKYGFGQLTGIDLPGEKSGLLPTPEWKKENFTGWAQNWQLFDTYYTSIGQGANQDTVLQLASYTATIANRGVRMKPYLVEEIVDDEGTVLKATEPTIVEDLKLSDEIANDLIQAMKDVVSGEGGGTAANLFKNLPANLQPAGKTGTAQTGLKGDDNDGDYHGAFIAFAPADDPQVAYAGLVEYGEHGSTSAGRVCEAAFDAYFGYSVDYDVIVSHPEE